MATTSSPSDEPRTLLTLPAEIRRKIWDFALNTEVKFCANHERIYDDTRHDEVISVSNCKIWDPNGTSLLPNPHLGLLLACKTVYNEVKDISISVALACCSQQCAESSVLNLWTHQMHSLPRGTITCVDTFDGESFGQDHIESMIFTFKWIGAEYPQHLNDVVRKREYTKRLADAACYYCSRR